MGCVGMALLTGVVPGGCVWSGSSGCVLECSSLLQQQQTHNVVCTVHCEEVYLDKDVSSVELLVVMNGGQCTKVRESQRPHCRGMLLGGGVSATPGLCAGLM